MPEFMSGRPRLVQPLETLMVHTGMIKVKHDGGGLLDNLPPSWKAESNTSALYVRTYEIQVGGKPTGLYMKFCYNLRDDWADIKISHSDLKFLNGWIRKAGIKNVYVQVHAASRDKAVPTAHEDDRRNSSSVRQNGLSNSV